MLRRAMEAGTKDGQLWNSSAKKLLDRLDGEIARDKVPGAHFDKVKYDDPPQIS